MYSKQAQIHDSFPVEAKIMMSNRYPITGKQTVISFLTLEVSIATV